MGAGLGKLVRLTSFWKPNAWVLYGVETELKGKTMEMCSSCLGINVTTFEFQDKDIPLCGLFGNPNEGKRATGPV